MMAAAPVCLVQGASRGVGLQFCSTLLARKNWQVIATCRKPSEAENLTNLKDQHPQNLTVLPVDCTEEDTIARAASEVGSRFGKLDMLINSAAILHPTGKGETSLKSVSAEDVQATLFTNATGPLLIAKYFSPLLLKGQGLVGMQAKDQRKQHCSLLINISAKVGSVADNELGGWYSYRMSKAALNMATKNLSIELGRGQKKVICISLHPGTVDTGLSRPYHQNVKHLFSAEQSVGYMLKVIESLSPEDSGKFFLYDRTVMPF